MAIAKVLEVCNRQPVPVYPKEVASGFENVMCGPNVAMDLPNPAVVIDAKKNDRFLGLSNQFSKGGCAFSVVKGGPSFTDTSAFLSWMPLALAIVSPVSAVR